MWNCLNLSCSLKNYIYYIKYRFEITPIFQCFCLSRHQTVDGVDGIKDDFDGFEVEVAFADYQRLAPTCYHSSGILISPVTSPIRPPFSSTIKYMLSLDTNINNEHSFPIKKMKHVIISTLDER